MAQRHRPARIAGVRAKHVAVGQHRHALRPTARSELAEQPSHVALGPADAAGKQRQEAQRDVHAHTLCA